MPNIWALHAFLSMLVRRRFRFNLIGHMLSRKFWLLLSLVCRLKQRRLLRPIHDGASWPRRKPRDFMPCLISGDADVVGALQVKPELRARAEPVSEAKGGVTFNATASMNDLRHAIGRD